MNVITAGGIKRAAAIGLDNSGQPGDHRTPRIARQDGITNLISDADDTIVDVLADLLGVENDARAIAVALDARYPTLRSKT